MQTTKKSRKFSILAAILILLTGVLIGGYLVLKSHYGVAGQLSEILGGNSLSLKDCQPNPSESTADSDNDGLKDWEEMQIYQSEPCQADTDGDGYLDGEEVASGYDPTKKAPGDELPGTQAKGPRPLPHNLTEALRQRLASQITQNKITSFNDQGELLSSEELENYPGIQQLTQEIMNNYAGLFAPDKIDESQIKTTPDNSGTSIQHYAAMAATIGSLPKPKNLTSQSETEMFVRAIENNDFSEVDQYLGIYQNIYKNLKELTVPSDLLELHKEQLNIFSSLIKIYQGIKEINTDPLKANLALQSYQSIRGQFINWTENFAEFIEKHP